MATRSDDRALAQELLALERQYWQALLDHDADAALALTSDPVIVAGAQGVGKLDKDSMAGMLAGEQSYTLESFAIDDDAQALRLSDDVAVLAYKVHERLVVDGKPIELDAADASTWVRRDGAWSCALHTESILGDPFGRDRAPRA